MVGVGHVEDGSNNPQSQDIHYLAHLHFDERDVRIYMLEDVHKYIVDGKNDQISVSTLVKRYFRDFDSKKAIQCVRYSKKYNSSHPLWQKTDEEIKKLWEENGARCSAAGTLMHKHLEIFYNRYAKNKFQTHSDFYLDFPPSNEFKQFRTFHEQVIVWIQRYFGVYVYRTEKQIFIEKYKISGTPDILFRYPVNENVMIQPDDLFQCLDSLQILSGEKAILHLVSDYLIEYKYILMDWKDSKDLELKKDPRYIQKGLPPLQHIPDLKFWHYALNLSLYRYILETVYHYDVSQSLLVVFHPTYNDEYYIFESPYLLPEVELLLQLREQELEAESIQLSSSSSLQMYSSSLSSSSSSSVGTDS